MTGPLAPGVTFKIQLCGHGPLPGVRPTVTSGRVAAEGSAGVRGRPVRCFLACRVSGCALRACSVQRQSSACGSEASVTRKRLLGPRVFTPGALQALGAAGDSARPFRLHRATCPVGIGAGALLPSSNSAVCLRPRPREESSRAFGQTRSVRCVVPNSPFGKETQASRERMP